MAFHSYFLHHYYIYPPSHSFQHKNSFSSPLLSHNEVEWSCHILIFLRLKILSEIHSSSPNFSFPPPLRPLPRVSSSTIWILYESIIYFPNMTVTILFSWICLNILKCSYVFFICSWLFITCSCITLASILNLHQKHKKDVCLIIFLNSWI